MKRKNCYSVSFEVNLRITELHDGTSQRSKIIHLIQLWKERQEVNRTVPEMQESFRHKAVGQSIAGSKNLFCLTSKREGNLPFFLCTSERLSWIFCVFWIPLRIKTFWPIYFLCIHLKYDFYFMSIYNRTCLKRKSIHNTRPSLSLCTDAAWRYQGSST